MPVAFGVLTVNTPEQAEARIEGGRRRQSALEMADLSPGCAPAPA